MKILYIIEHHYPHIGGVERVFINLTEALVKQGHECIVLTSRLPGTKPHQTVNGVKIIRVWTPPFLHRYWFALLAIPKAIALAKKHDIIHTTTYTGSIPARFTSIVTKTPAIITIHEVFGKKWRTLTRVNPFTAWLSLNIEQFIARLRFQKAACPSDYTRKFAIQLGSNPNTTTTIYNGVDYDHFNPKKTDKTLKKKLGLDKNFVVLSFGRPGLSKGIEYLVQAAPEIIKKIPKAKIMLILSDSPKDRYNYIKKLIKDLNLKDHVILKKPVPFNELPSYIASADCVVVPSLSEGFGYTAAEACAMDVPVVASDAGALPEVVSGRFVLVEPKNPHSIAHGVEKVFKKHYTVSKRKRFTWEKFVKEYYALYQDMLKK